MQNKKLLWGIVLSLVLVGGLYLLNRYWLAPAMHPGASHGEHPPAPDFVAMGLDGQELRLADYKGKVVLLNFWATWCGPCRVEIPGLVDFVHRYGDQGFAVMGISMDDGPEPVRKFYREFNMNYPVAMGNAEIAQLYGGVFGLPTSFLIGRDGRIYSKHVGLTSLSVFEEEIKTLLAQEGDQELTHFDSAAAETGQGEPIELGNPSEIYSEVPGVDLSGLSNEGKEAFKAALAEDECTCGCGLTLLQCRTEDSSCSVSLRLAREKLAAMQKP